MTDITGNIGNTSTFIDDAPNDIIIKIIGVGGGGDHAVNHI